VRIKIQGGTASGTEDLCATCHHAMRRKGLNGSELLHCSMFDKQWREPTSECNMYADRRIPSYREMEGIAWKVSNDPKEKVGFRAPKPEDRLPSVIHILDEAES
jgi:hypothetical protein